MQYEVPHLPMHPISNIAMTPSDSPARPWRSRFATVNPRAYLGLHGLGGVLIVTALLWAFGAIVDAVGEKGAMVNLDVVVADWLQSHGSEAGESIFSLVSWIGAPVLAAVLVIVMVAFAIKRDWVRTTAVASAGVGGALLSYAMKALFHRGRPDFATEFIHGTSWSFPSGHAMDSLAGYGVLAYLLLEVTHEKGRRRAIIATTIVLVGAIGFSRLYLGVHYLSDVVGGYIAGAVWLLVCIVGYRFAASHRFDAGSSPGS